jgi:hypothetical protein
MASFDYTSLSSLFHRVSPSSSELVVIISLILSQCPPPPPPPVTRPVVTSAPRPVIRHGAKPAVEHIGQTIEICRPLALKQPAQETNPVTPVLHGPTNPRTVMAAVPWFLSRHSFFFFATGHSTVLCRRRYPLSRVSSRISYHARLHQRTRRSVRPRRRPLIVLRLIIVKSSHTINL